MTTLQCSGTCYKTFISTKLVFIASNNLPSQGKGKRYRLGEIFEDDSKCPPVDYKCKRIRGMRNLDWEQMESGNFDGR